MDTNSNVDFFDDKEIVNKPEPKPIDIPVNTLKSDKEGIVPALLGDNYPDEYMSVVKRIQAEYKKLPRLNYEDIYTELAELNVKSNPTPTPQSISDELQRVQAAKDRLSEIFLSVHKNFSFKKRAVDILQEAWAQFADDKSADKRTGDATFRISGFLSDLGSTEGLLKACFQILKNLDSAHERLSRTITTWQLMLKLNDIGRGPTSDWDMNKLSERTTGGHKSDDIGSQSAEPPLEDF